MKKVDSASAVKRVLAGEQQGAAPVQRPASSAKLVKGGSSSQLTKTGSSGKLGVKAAAKKTKTRPESSKVAPPAQEEEAVEEASTEPEVEEPAPPPVAAVSGLAGKRNARPASARPPPPKIRTNKVMPQEAPAATPIIFQEVKSKIEDEEESFIAVAANDEPIVANSEADLTEGGPGQDERHGGLVRKILENKREFGGETDEQKKEEDVSLLPKDKQIAKREVFVIHF